MSEPNRSRSGARDRRVAARGRFARVLGIGALLGLGLSGCSAPSGTTGQPESGPGAASRPRVWRPAQADTLGPVVAIVGQHRITRHEVDSLLATAPPNARAQYYQSPDQYRQVVNRMVENQVFYDAAKRAGLEQDSAYRVEMAGVSYQLLIKHFYEKQLERVPDPSDSAIGAFYEQNAKEFEQPARARIRHILVKTEAQAKAARRELAGGASWETMVKRVSIDTLSKPNAGLLGYVTNESDAVPGVGKAPAVIAAAFKIKEGEVSQPLKSGKGWHLIMVEDVHPAGHTPLSDVRQQILSSLKSRTEETFTNSLVDSLKQFAGVTIFDDSIAAVLRPARSPQQLFEMAQAAAAPRDRISLYRQLVAKYPNERVSEQASFMVGFTYAEELDDYDSARKAFAEFMKQYPRSDLVKSAQWMLSNMDKPTPPFEGESPADSLGGALRSGTTISFPDTIRLAPTVEPPDSSRGGGRPNQ